MFTGWFTLGDQPEIGSNQRAYEYSRQSECARWIRDPDCPGMVDALNAGLLRSAGPDASFLAIEDAPWYDPDESVYSRASRDFYGIYVLAMDGLGDSTWGASITQGITDGGQISRGRHAAREVRIRAFMLAASEAGMEYGMTWLAGALKPGGCGMHGTACGESSFSFLADCPPEKGDMSDVEYAGRIMRLRRYLHGAKIISGPLRVQEYKRQNAVGLEVEFTIGAENPHIYTELIEPDLDRTVGSVVLDSPFNLAPYPSAELTEGTVTIGRNRIANPSFEVGLSDWQGLANTVSGDSASTYTTLQRVASPAPIQGDWAGMVQLLGDGSTSASGISRLTAQYMPQSYYVDLSDLPQMGGVDLTAWASAQVISGSDSEVRDLRLEVAWLGEGLLDILREDHFPASDVTSHTWSETLIAPKGAQGLGFLIVAEVAWASDPDPAINSDIRLYLDGVALLTH